MQTDYDTFSVIYSCQNYVFDIVKYELAWVLTRKPLDRNNSEDASEINRIYTIAKDLLNKNVPDFDFDSIMRPTVQGSDCDYQ